MLCDCPWLHKIVLNLWQHWQFSRHPRVVSLQRQVLLVLELGIVVIVNKRILLGISPVRGLNREVDNSPAHLHSLVVARQQWCTLLDQD